MIAYFAQHKTAANVLMIMILLLGGFALPQLQRDTFPITPTKNIEVKISYPGATSQQVAQEICIPLENTLDRLDGIKEFACDARENLALGNIEMQPGQDIDRLTNDVQQQINTISDFPDKAEKALVTKLDRIASVVAVAITGPMSDLDLYLYANQIKQQLKANPMIEKVIVSGFSDQEISIEISDWKLQQYGLSISDLSNKIAQENIELPVGIITNSAEQQSVRLDQKANNVNQLKKLLIDGNSQLFLGDIAKLDQHFTVEEERILFNGQRAALLQISKSQFQDTLAVRSAVKTIIDQQRKLAPTGIEMTLTQDVSVNIQDRLRLLTSNGLQGLVLAFCALWAFFNIRFSFWVTVGLPVSFLGAIFTMHTLGYTINMMTMVGMIVAIGLLMDDSLIIAENIAAKRESGLDPFTASVEGTRQVLPGVLASFATTAMIVGPLMFLSGNLGDILRYIPIILLLTLLVSLLEAFFILPSHLAHSRLTASQNPLRRKIMLSFENLRDKGFIPLASLAMKAPYLTLGLLLMIVMLSTATFSAGWLKFRTMPTLESDTLQARILLPQGSLFSQTEMVAQKVTHALAEINQEYKKQYGETLVKSTSILYNTNIDAQESGPHIATVSADLLPAQFRQQEIKYLVQQWKMKVGPTADVLAIKFTDKERGIAGNGIDIRIHGNSMEDLHAVSSNLIRWLKQFEGVFNLSSNLRYGKDEIIIKLTSQANTLGISASQVAQTLRNAIKGNTDLSVFEQDEMMDLRIHQREFSTQATLETLQDLVITANNGRLVPLSAIATFDQQKTFSQIHRINGQNTVTVTGNINTQTANAREIMLQFYQKFIPQLTEKYPDIYFSSQGQDKESADTGASLLHYFIIGIIGVYLVLVFLFESYLQPFAVLMAIPMGWIGVIWGHLIMGSEISIPSLVGFATLAGIVVNDNILLITFIKEKLHQGLALPQACILAIHERFRAIIITSLTTIAGLFPLLSETSTQAQFIVPMIISIAFGLISATLFASIIVPCVLLILDDVKLNQKKFNRL